MEAISPGEELNVLRITERGLLLGDKERIIYCMYLHSEVVDDCVEETSTRDSQGKLVDGIIEVLLHLGVHDGLVEVEAVLVRVEY